MISELAYLPPKNSGKFASRKNYFRKDDTYIDNLIKFCIRYDFTNIYACMYDYENDEIDTCDILADFYLDFDRDDGVNDEKGYAQVVREVLFTIHYLESYYAITPEQIRLYFSGHKGFHLIIPKEVFGIYEPSKDLNIRYKNFACHIARECKLKMIDLSIYDRKRLFRITNTINAKSGLYKVPITFKQLNTLSFEEMKAWASSPREVKEKVPELNMKAARRYLALKIIDDSKAKGTERRSKHELEIPVNPRPLLPCALELLENGAQQGTRNHATVRLASSLMQAGHPFDETEEIMQEWNKTKNVPPLSNGELETTISSAYNMILSGRGYGCSAFKELGVCIGAQCKLAQQK